MLARTIGKTRSASHADLDTINAITRSCVMAWDIPDRVKRLSLPSYLYSSLDLDHLVLHVAENAANEIIGLAAVEEPEASDLPSGKSGLLLQGLYVAADYQQQGIGGQLLSVAITCARKAGVDGLLVKAQADAISFFEGRGFQPLAIDDASRDYPHRLWLPV